MLVRKVERCPACDTSVEPVAVASTNEHVRKQFLDYSKKKYQGFLDNWLDQMELVIDRCPVCGHCWYREQPEQAMLSEMYEARARVRSDKTSFIDKNATPAMALEMRRLSKLVGKSEP